MKLLKILPIALFFILFTCNKDDDGAFNNPNNNNPNPTAFAENFGSEIQRTFLGTVIDKNQNPIEGATITIGSSTAMTDANGVFIIRDATINERFGYVKAEKAGYLHGSRSVVPTNGTNKVSIMLLEETVAGTTNSGTSETIALSNGASVALQGEYINEDGSAYSGSVNVIMHHLDPSDEEMQQQMPGMLYAANAQNEERMLQTFGMLAVELRGSAGETLNLAEGSSAEIKVPLDASLLANAPANIPLWHFDETYGYWVEDGEANLVGNAYVGTVTHFSFWNCDIPAEAVNLCVTVTDVNGIPISNLLVTLDSSLYGSSYGYTNNLGEVCGLVPRNEVLNLEIYMNNYCSNENIYSDVIGPFSQNSSSEIQVNSTFSGVTQESIIGNFNSCVGDPISEGYVELNHENQTFINSVDDGNFEFSFLRCPVTSDIFSLKAYDYTNIQETDQINFSFTSPVTDVGNILSCNNIEEFITYQIDNDTIWTHQFNLTANFIPISPSNASPIINISVGGQGECFYLQGFLTDFPYIGTYDSYDYNIPEDIGFWIAECLDMSETNNNITYNLNFLGDVGEYIDINFSGDYEDYNGNPHTITGTIHVIRDN